MKNNIKETVDGLIECFGENTKHQPVQNSKCYMLFNEKDETVYIEKTSDNHCGNVYIILVSNYQYLSIDGFMTSYFKHYPKNYAKYQNYLRLKKLSQSCFNC
jgi:hypothetical protein